MWVFTNDAMISAVEDRDDDNILWVRARHGGDLERFFGDLRVVVKFTPDADYAYRTIVTREDFTQALILAVDKIDYDNFKGSIPQTKAGNRRHDVYLRCWSELKRWQSQALALRNGGKRGKAKVHG